jgi:hypothetical protein
MEVAAQYFPVINHRTLVCHDDLVICRHSATPFYHELCADIRNMGGEPLQPYHDHNYIADFHWYDVPTIRENTPRSWTDRDFYACPYDGPFVVKGRCKSLKFEWNTKMFAYRKYDAVKIGNELMKDPDIGREGVVYRMYEPLKTYEIGLNGLRFTNEWRFFFYKQHMLSYGYYWSIAQNIPDKSELPSEAVNFAQMLANSLKNYVTFFVLDIAQKESGSWTLIEVNDGQCSGLSECDPHELYSNLKKVLNGEESNCTPVRSSA